MNFFKKILEIIFPSHCLYCEKIISAEGLFCNDCWQKLQFITEPKCNICSNPFEFVVGDNLTCSSCLSNPPSYDASVVIFRYNQIIGKVIGDLKYRDSTYIANKLAKILFIQAQPEIAEADFIIAVPLHIKRLRKRRFNQSVLLCRALTKTEVTKTKLIPDFLLRIKNTAAQVSLRKKQRQNNLKSAFALNPKYQNIIKDKKILLIDDVMTTGATLENCAKILKKSGAKKVTILTIAKTIFY